MLRTVLNGFNTVCLHCLRRMESEAEVQITGLHDGRMLGASVTVGKAMTRDRRNSICENKALKHGSKNRSL